VERGSYFPISHWPGRSKGNNGMSLYGEADTGHRLEHEIPQHEADVLLTLQEYSTKNLRKADVAESTK
jgi:hypothetical protein